MSDPTPAVYGRCPACGSASLYLGDGGHITCSSSDCPRPQLADELLGEIGDARLHGAYTFCSQLVGHVNMTAFAKKISEKRIALSQRDEAADYAHQQKQRADNAEATVGRVRAARDRIARSRVADAIYCLDLIEEALNPQSAHNAGPTVAECAAADRCWDYEKQGE